jgi:hypothetical protein
MARSQLKGATGCQDAGEWSVQVSRGRSEEGGSQLINRLQPMGGIKLRHGVVAKVEEHPKPVAWNAGLVVHHDSLVTCPSRPTIFGSLPEGDTPWLEGLLTPFVRGKHPVTVGGM